MEIAERFDVRDLLRDGQGPPRWVKVLDQTRCIGCHACTTACKSENLVPLGVTRTYVKAVEVGSVPAGAARVPGDPLQPVRGRAVRGRLPDRGDVPAAGRDRRLRQGRCIGCKACIAACPYDAIFINPDDHSAEKCNFCSHRIDAGLEPACVVVCPIEAILVGDLERPGLARRGDRQPRAGRPSAGRRRRRGRRSSTAARRRRRSTRSRPGGPRAACSCGASRAGARRPAIPAGAQLVGRRPARLRRRRTARRGTGASACTRGRRASPRARTSSPRRSRSPARSAGRTRSGSGRRRLIALGMLAATGAILVADLEHPRALPPPSSRARSGGAGSCAARSSSAATAACSRCT